MERDPVRSIDPDAAGLGKPRSVEDEFASGLDTCRLQLMCWNVDPQTQQGRCAGFCIEDGNNLICEDPDAECQVTSDGFFCLCSADCDPLAQHCLAGDGCYGTDASFLCAPDASGDQGARGDGCEIVNACDPGLACVDAASVVGCTGSLGCCTPFCALDDPAPPCQTQEECVPFFELGASPPDYVNVGLCLVLQ